MAATVHSAKADFIFTYPLTTIRPKNVLKVKKIRAVYSKGVDKNLGSKNFADFNSIDTWHHTNIVN